jgi:alpha-beta hydrolase superfamily lysophospholipase
LIALGEHAAQSTGLPVFVIGASPGAAIADRALSSYPDTGSTPLTQNRPRKDPKCILLPPS